MPRKRTRRNRNRRRPPTTPKSREPTKSIEGVLIGFPWRRDWGKPPGWIVLAVTLFDVAILAGWVIIGIAGATELQRNLPSDGQSLGVAFIAAAVWLAAGGWLLRSLLRAWRYRQSFDWSAERQANLDAKLKDDEIGSLSDDAHRHRAIVKECVETLSAMYSVKPCGDAEYERVERRLLQFTPRGNPQRLHMVDAYRVTSERQSCTWLTLEYEYHYRTGKYGGTDKSQRQAVLIQLPFDAGSVFIRPELLSDVFTELFAVEDVDFEHHATFSRSYFVIAVDPQRAQEMLSGGFMDAFCDEPRLIARIEDSWLLVLRDCNLSVAESTMLVKTALRAAS